MEIWLTVRYVRIARWGDCEENMKMTIDEAMAIIRKEYLCVDRDCDIERNCGKCDLMMPSKEPILEAYKMAIKALEREQQKYTRPRHCDCCGTPLTKDNNKCGYELCDECNERLEQEFGKGQE